MRWTFWVFALLSVTSVRAQSNLDLLIVDSLTREPLAGARIEIQDLSGRAVVLAATDTSGRAELAVPNANIRITVRYVGYAPQTRVLNLSRELRLQLTVALVASEQVLQILTVTTSKYERPLEDVTVSLDVIKPDLLRAVNALTPEAVLDKLPGVNMLDGQPNIRGGAGWSYGAGSRVLLLVDDIPALQADAGSANWTDMPVETTEQIEVVKGAASALYGSSAMNGIINLRTAYAKSEPETRLALFGGTWGSPAQKNAMWWDEADQPRPMQGGGSLTHKRKIGRLDLVASGFYRWEQSFRQTSWSRGGRATLNTRYQLTDNLSAGVNINYNDRAASSFLYWLNDTTGALRPNPITDPVNTHSRRFFVDPFVSYFAPNGDRHRVLGRLYSVTNDANAGRSNSNQYYYGEYQYRHSWSRPVSVTTGAVISGNAIEAELYGDTTFFSRNLAHYAQLEWRPMSRLILEGGYRIEHNTIIRPEIVGQDTLVGGRQREYRPVLRAGANYRIGRATHVRVSWGQGYRYPTVAELFIETSAGFQIRPNPRLRSENGWSSELGVKQGIRLGTWQGFADASVFWSRYFDMMEFNIQLPGLYFQSINVGNTDIRGGELSLMGQGAISGLPMQILAGYTYLDPRFRTEEDRRRALTTTDRNILKYRFQHVVKSDIQIGLGKYFDWGVVYNYNSEMVNIDAFFELFIPGLRNFRKTHKDFGVLDTRIIIKPTADIQLTLTGTNLLNEVYTLRPAQLEAPRGGNVRLDWKF